MADSASDEILEPRCRLPPHRPRERLAPNQHLMFGKVWMSLICDSCGNRMPKWSVISFVVDDEVLAYKRHHSLGLIWTKMLHDCTNPNCLAEITVKRKGMEIVVGSGATPYFRTEDEKLGSRMLRIYQGNTASSRVVASSSSSVAAAKDGEPQG